jgi:N-acetylglucosamine kinase-like BadF-type ATPase
MTLVIGVDAGASHTEALLWTDLTPVARHTGGPGAISPGAVEEAARAIASLVKDLAHHAAGNRPIDALVVGAAGAGRETHRAGLEAALKVAGVAHRIAVTTDGHIALQSAFGDEPGILLTAGTGSFGLARDPQGVLRRTGGHGWQFGDEGSGYALAAGGVAAAARAADLRGPVTMLTETLPQASGTGGVGGLLEWARQAEVAALASLATAVLQTALAGDAVARSLVAAAGRDLAAHVHALLTYFPPGKGAAVAFSGGLLVDDSAVRQALLAALEPDSDRLLITPAKVDPAAGAVALARRLVSGGR